MAKGPETPAFSASELDAFVQKVMERGTELYRDLPWRNTQDPYAVLVSEVMLQQTQVSRVLPKWEHWLRLFPTADALAAADTADVLAEWQGLGYNRRALALKRAAETCAEQNAGVLPDTYEGLLALPGVGPATAAGVTAFAYDLPAVYLETNVRTVLLHELFPSQLQVPDKLLTPILEAVCPPHPRAWYYALLDYGWHLKQTNPNPSRRSSGYTRQSRFEGSRRQKRAAIVRIVLEEPGASLARIHELLDAEETAAGRPLVDSDTVSSIVSDLAAEGFFAQNADGGYSA